jgi:hypothetical protein
VVVEGKLSLRPFPSNGQPPTFSLSRNFSMSQNTQPTKQHERRSLFRPCIDLHGGLVKQIVGGTLADGKEREGELKTNFVSE